MAVDEDRGLQLPVLNSKHFHHSLNLDLVAYCDSRDLVAIASDKDEVIAYRVNGQVAFTIRRRPGDEVHITTISWEPSGASLAVGWDDGSYAIHSGENGRILSQGSARTGRSDASADENPWRLDLNPFIPNDEDGEDGPVVERFGWSRGRASNNAAKSTSVIDGLNTDDWLLHDHPGDDVGLAIDIPQSKAVLAELSSAIMTLDATKSLPRLSAFPTHGMRASVDASKFASQPATDSIFESSSGGRLAEVNCLLVCGSDAQAHVLMDETVQIGSCRLSGAPLLHTAGKSGATQCVLTRDSQGGFAADLIALPLEKLGGPLLHVTAVNTKRIQNLLAYITHGVRCIQHDFTSGLQFPDRLLRNMNMELEEKNEDGDVVLNLSHLAMTGEFSPTMLEWLVDVVKDTNHKRWDLAINGMYGNIQNHLFMHLLPALDRLSIAVTTLRGHAKFHDGAPTFDVPVDAFTRILDAVDSLRLVVQKAQLVIAREHRQFRAFSKWLRVMIDIGVAGPGGKTAIETEEREVVNFDYVLLLGYINQVMMRSSARLHLDPRPTMTGGCTLEDFLAHPVIASFSYERVKAALTALDCEHSESLESLSSSRTQLQSPVSVLKEVPDVTALANLPALTALLVGRARIAIDSITQWQSRMLRHPTTVAIPCSSDMRVLDVLVDDEDHGSGAIVTVLALLKGDEPVLECHSARAGEAPTISTLPPPTPSHAVLSARFNGRGSCLALVVDRADDTHSLVHMKLPRTQNQGRLATPGPGSEDGSNAVIVHNFSSTDGTNFMPEEVLLGGRPGKRVCIVIGNRQRMWKILDLSARPALAA